MPLRPSVPARMACIAAAGILSAACGPAAPATPAAAEPTAAAEPIRLKVAVLNFTSYGPFFIAQEEGFFTEQGLEVEFVKFDSGAQMIPALEQGQIDAAATGPSIGFFNAVAQDGKIKIVADKGYLDPSGCDYMAVLAGPDWIASHPHPAADDFRGRKISIDPSNFEAFMFEKILSPLGLTLADMTAESISPPSLLDAAQNRSVDFISIGDPWITRLADTGAMAVWRPYQDVAPNMQFGILAFGQLLLRDRPETGVQFMTAYLKAVRQYNEGKTDRNIEIMAEYTKLDAGLLQRACWPPMKNDGSIDLTTILEFQTWAVGKGLLEAGSPGEALWDSRFIDGANAALGD